MAKLTRSSEKKNSLNDVLELDEQSTVYIDDEIHDIEDTEKEATESDSLENKADMKTEKASKPSKKVALSFAEQLRKINSNNSHIVEAIRVSCLDAATKENATQAFISLKKTEAEWEESGRFVIETLDSWGLTLVLVETKKELEITVSW